LPGSRVGALQARKHGKKPVGKKKDPGIDFQTASPPGGRGGRANFTGEKTTGGSTRGSCEEEQIVYTFRRIRGGGMFLKIQGEQGDTQGGGVSFPAKRASGEGGRLIDRLLADEEGLTTGHEKEKVIKMRMRGKERNQEEN